MQEKENSRIVYLDVLNIVAIIAVIALHCNSIVHGSPNVKAWTSSLVVECICYFAVPLFCMLSGATLMRYREKYDTKTFFKKRFLKVGIPFLFWAVIMFIWKIHIQWLDIQQFTSITDWINAFFSNKEEATYYFMFVILGIYLTMPLLSLVAKKEYHKTLWLMILLFFIFNAFLPNIFKVLQIQYNASLTVQIGDYVVFVLLGYLLSTEKIDKKYRIFVYIGAILGLIYRFTTTYIGSMQAGSVVKASWGYSSWHSILLTSAVFLWIKNLHLEEKLANKEKVKYGIMQIASCSFGIYLIHKIVIYYEQAIFPINVMSWQWRTIGIITTYLISLGIVFLLKKIPVCKRVVP